MLHGHVLIEIISSEIDARINDPLILKNPPILSYTSLCKVMFSVPTSCLHPCQHSMVKC